MPKIDPLWDGYESSSEQQLISTLSRKVKAANDPANPSSDQKSARDLAQAIASHEWLRKEHDGEHHAELYSYAKSIALKDVGSWRPK